MCAPRAVVPEALASTPHLRGARLTRVPHQAAQLTGTSTLSLAPAIHGGDGLLNHAVYHGARIELRCREIERDDTRVDHLSFFRLVRRVLRQKGLEECSEPERVATDHDDARAARPAPPGLSCAQEYAARRGSILAPACRLRGGETRRWNTVG